MSQSTYTPQTYSNLTMYTYMYTVAFSDIQYVFTIFQGWPSRGPSFSSPYWERRGSLGAGCQQEHHVPSSRGHSRGHGNESLYGYLRELTQTTHHPCKIEQEHKKALLENTGTARAETMKPSLKLHHSYS